MNTIDRFFITMMFAATLALTVVIGAGMAKSLNRLNEWQQEIAETNYIMACDDVPSEEAHETYRDCLSLRLVPRIPATNHLTPRQ